MGPLADFIVFLHDGKVVKQGGLKDVLDDDIELFKEFEEEDVLKNSEEELDEPPEPPTEEKNSSTGKLIVVEEIQLGRVSRESRTMNVLRLYGSNG
jgi:ABC-type glutathione transport system ATPase component